MNVENIEPGFDFDNQRFRDSEEFGNLALGDAKFLSGLDAAK
jgi:hypothetical protein